MLHHFTWFINSLAHYWGHQNYSTEHSAVDNYIICLLTFGEGYHNYHHTFAYDYRNGIRWYHFDPTKWLIWMLHKLGLARDLKVVNNARIAEQMIKEGCDDIGCHHEKFVKAVLEYKDLIAHKIGDDFRLNGRLVAEKP